MDQAWLFPSSGFKDLCLDDSSDCFAVFGSFFGCDNDFPFAVGGFDVAGHGVTSFFAGASTRDSPFCCFDRVGDTRLVGED